MALYGILYRMLLKNYIRRNRGKNEKLFAQIVKFGIVGFISFGIDYVTGLIVLNLVMALTSSSYFEMASLVGSVAGFTVSVIANYILSFKFVFERKEDLNKKVEFITFVVLSLIGMLLNSFLIWIVVGPIYRGEHCTAAAHRLQPDFTPLQKFLQLRLSWCTTLLPEKSFWRRNDSEKNLKRRQRRKTLPSFQRKIKRKGW